MSVKMIMFVTDSFMHTRKVIEELGLPYILCKTKEGMHKYLKIWTTMANLWSVVDPSMPALGAVKISRKKMNVPCFSPPSRRWIRYW